jgi:hypothetical protein
MPLIHASAVVAATGLASLGLGSAAPAAAPAPSTVTSTVVVSEVAPSGPSGSSDEFVEVRNTGQGPVDVGGWDLVACLSPDTWQAAVTFPVGLVIPSGGRLLLAHAHHTGLGPAPDLQYLLDLPDDGGWLLVDWGSGYSDGVGLGADLPCTEGDPAPECDWAAGQTVTRDGLGNDTDDNSADFTCRS